MQIMQMFYLILSYVSKISNEKCEYVNYSTLTQQQQQQQEEDHGMQQKDASY